MGWDFPLSFGSEEAALIIYDMNGNILNDTLDNSTYASFGTVPRGSTSLVKLYVENSGLATIYSAKLVGIESSEQYGDAEDTYEAMNLPIELGNLEGKEIAEVNVEWEIPSDISLGLKIWGIQAQDSDTFDFIDNHEYFKKITITNNDTNPMLDFQVKIDFDNTFDWANTTSDGRDLRVYDTDFKALPHFVRYWMPALELGQVYVKVPKIESGESIDIYLGYGKFDLVSTSTPTALLFYEKFTDGFYNQWVNTGTITYEFNALGIKLLTATAVETGLVVAFPECADVAFDIAITRTASNALHKGGLWATVVPDADVTSGGAGAALYQIIARDYGTGTANDGIIGTKALVPVGTTYGRVEIFDNGTIKSYYDSTDTITPTLLATSTTPTKSLYLRLSLVQASHPVTIHYIYAYKIPKVAPTIVFADVADITAEFTNPDVASGISACVGNVIQQIQIYDTDFRSIMYQVGDFNAFWRLPGTEGIQIWGIYQPRPVGDYYFPDTDNLGINDALFFTITDYLVDIHDKIDIEGVRFDLQAIQVHPIADQKIYKMCVLKRQPEYYATCTGTVS